MNKKLLWLMFCFLALPLFFAAQPISQAAEGWSDWISIGGATNSAPTIYPFQDKLVVVIQGSDNSTWLRWSRDGKGWDNWYNAKMTNVAEATLGSYGNTAFIFNRTTDNRITYTIQTSLKSFANKQYALQEIKGARTPSAPSAVTFEDGVYLFFRGTDNHIYYAYGKYPMKAVYEVPGGGLTTSEPRAAVINNQIYLAVRGTDDCIYLNIKSAGGSWRGWQQIPGGGKTLSGPAVGSINGSVYLMVRGTDNGIYVNSTRSGNWSGWRSIGGQTISGPSLATFKGTLFAVVRGTDNSMYLSYLQENARGDEHGDKDDRHEDRHDARDSQRDDARHDERDRHRDGDRRREEVGLNDSKIIENNIPDKMKAGQSYNVSITIKNTGDASWTANRKYQLGASGDGKLFGPTRLFINDNKVRSNEKITFSFTMTAPANPGEYSISWQMLQDKDGFGDKLTKIIKVRKIRQDGRWDDDEDRRDGDHRDRNDHRDDRDRDRDRNNDRHDDDRHASGWSELPGNGRTLSAPATCNFGNNLYMMVRGTDNGIYLNTLNNNNWSGWSNIGGATPSQGTLTNFNGSLFAFVRGTDNAIYVNRNQGDGFKGWSKVPGGGATLSGPAAASFNGRLYVVVRGTDSAIYINSMNAKGIWTGWSLLGGNIPSEPSIEVHEGRLFVFARGTNDGIWVNKFNGNAWSDWSEVPGNGRTSAGPSAYSYDGQLYLAVQGTDNGIWINSLKGNRWSGWSQVPGKGKTPSGPSISSYRGKLFVFVRGTDNAIYQNEL